VKTSPDQTVPHLEIFPPLGVHQCNIPLPSNFPGVISTIRNFPAVLPGGWFDFRFFGLVNFPLQTTARSTFVPEDNSSTAFTDLEWRLDLRRYFLNDYLAERFLETSMSVRPAMVDLLSFPI